MISDLKCFTLSKQILETEMKVPTPLTLVKLTLVTDVELF